MVLWNIIAKFLYELQMGARFSIQGKREGGGGMSERCANCGSYAFNLWRENIEQGGLCDRHYWQERAEKAEAERDELKLELIGAQSESDARQILLKQVQQERDELKRRVAELEAFLDWTERDEEWDKSWNHIMSEWKEVGE